MDKVIEVMNGRFGKYVLKPVYRRIWKGITWSVATVLALVAFFALVQVWGYCAEWLDYVIRG